MILNDVFGIDDTATVQYHQYSEHRLRVPKISLLGERRGEVCKVHFASKKVEPSQHGSTRFPDQRPGPTANFMHHADHAQLDTRSEDTAH